MSKRYPVCKPFRKCGRRKASVRFMNYIRHIRNVNNNYKGDGGFILQDYTIFGLPVYEGDMTSIKRLEGPMT